MHYTYTVFGFFFVFSEHYTIDDINHEEEISGDTSLHDSDQAVYSADSKCERKLKMFRRQMQIYGEEARSQSDNIPPAPNVPNANNGKMSEDTFNQFKAGGNK